MTGLNAAAVSVGKPQAGGAIFAAPTDVTLPVDAVATLAPAFQNLGYASDEGLKNSIERNFQTITAWGGDEVLRPMTSQAESFEWTFIQTDKAVLSEVYGPDNVTEDNGALTVLHNSSPLPHRAYVFEVLMTGDRVLRIVVPNGQIGDIGDVTYVDGDAISYTVTLACFPDAAGNTAYARYAALPSEGGSYAWPFYGVTWDYWSDALVRAAAYYLGVDNYSSADVGVLTGAIELLADSVSDPAVAGDGKSELRAYCAVNGIPIDKSDTAAMIADKIND